MGKHQLSGGVEVEVTAVNATLDSSPPRIEGSGRDRVLSFSKPTAASPLANIQFKFKATGKPSAFLFGIKQISTPTDYQALYAGLKDIDGSISMELPGFDDNRFLATFPELSCGFSLTPIIFQRGRSPRHPTCPSSRRAL